MYALLLPNIYSVGPLFQKEKKNSASQIWWDQVTAPSDVGVFKGLLSSDIFNAVQIWTANLATKSNAIAFSALPGH